LELHKDSADGKIEYKLQAGDGMVAVDTSPDGVEEFPDCPETVRD